MEDRGVMYRFIYISVLAFAAAYLSLALSGFFLPFKPMAVHVIYSLPLYVCSFILLLAAIADVSLREGKRVILRWLLLLSLTLVTAGYWVGGLMSFSQEAVITEGQVVVTTETPEVFRPIYVGKYARIPEVKLSLRELKPQFISNSSDIKSLKGIFTVTKKGNKARDVSLDLDRKYSGSGYSISMDEFGYSPRYVLMNRKGRELDSSFVFLRLFPHGSEDVFRLLSPLTYFLRYYPDGEDRPYFYVRVARNRDLVFSGDVSVGETFSYENAYMSIPEVRKWTKLRVEGNPGRPLLALGLLALIFTFAWELRQGGKS
jgi:hypothetical protein